MQPYTTTSADDYIRHRMSDMSVSYSKDVSPANPPESKVLSPLEPSSQPFFESYSRRGSVTEPSFHNDFRRPSITDLSNLPLPNSAVPSRRGSIATVTTDYDYSSRSPSPSPFVKHSRLYHENEAHPYASGRRDSLPSSRPGIQPSSSSTSQPPHSLYDPFQRRHSIATAEPYGNRPNNTQSPKYRGMYCNYYYINVFMHVYIYIFIYLFISLYTSILYTSSTHCFLYNITFPLQLFVSLQPFKNLLVMEHTLHLLVRLNQHYPTWVDTRR
jgi:hypothetical protein